VKVGCSIQFCVFQESSGGICGLEWIFATDLHVDVVTGGPNDEDVVDENVKLGDRLGSSD
jgi:hypothetical protein